MASGYEDQNDSNTLRSDPLLKMVCDSLPESGSDLASQPTISRLKNAVGREVQKKHTRDDFVLHFPVSIVVIDRRYDIRSINAAARRLLGISDPAVREDLLHMIQGAHYAGLRAAIDTAFREGQVASVTGFSVEDVTTGEQRHLQVTCYPQKDEAGRSRIDSVMVVVSDITELVQRRQQLEERLASVEAELERVRQEAKEERERQEALNRRLVETNRQLAEANLELTSINEELQATNEQYRISSEEAQGATEEVEILN